MIPISDLNFTVQEAGRFVERNICICGGRLVVAWVNQKYVLKCGLNKDHAGIRRNKSNMEVIEELMEKQQIALGKPVQTLAQVTGQDLEIILRNTYKGAPDLEIKKALMLCRKYDLDPLMKHLFLIKFKSKDGDTWATVMGIKATRTMARRRLSYSYVSGPRRMTEDEQINIFGEVSKDKFWAITTLKDRNGNIYPGYGFWPLDKDVYGADKGNTKWNMAFIRSERNALDKLMPEGSPPVEVVDENYIDSSTMPVTELLPADYTVIVAPDQPLETPKEATTEQTLLLSSEEQKELILKLLKQKGIEVKHAGAFIMSKYKVAGKSLAEVLKALTYVQAEDYIKDISQMQDGEGDKWKISG